MIKQITIINKVVGAASSGFYVRVEDQIKSASRLDGCLVFVKTAERAHYSSFEAAFEAAKEFRNRVHPDFEIRADCTIED